MNIEMVRALFGGWQETMIWSCLQGIMGRIYVDSQGKPESVAAVLGDFTFLSGKPDEAILLCPPENRDRDFRIMIPQNDEWAELIESHFGEKAKKITRYAFKKEPDVFVKEELEEIVRKLPPEYTMRMIDEEIYHWSRAQMWSRDWASQYEDYETYQRLGLGVVILRDGIPVSGASSYSSYQGGIEIQVDTKEEYRRKGLACICAAKLILECMERGLYPSWDAENLYSVAVAEKLGYHYECEYPAYVVPQ